MRVLVDDLHTDGAEELMEGLAAFDNVQVRLFNPFVRGRGSLFIKLVTSLDDLVRVNHRMHNKMFVADNALALIGGRNIADEYFMRARDHNFIDLDALAAGPVVQALSASFDAFWNSDYVYPIDLIVPRTAGTREERRTALSAVLAATEAPPPDLTIPARYLPYCRVPADLDSGRLPLIEAYADLRVDPLDKAAGTRLSDRAGTVRAFVGQFTRAAQREVVAISPYFVPGKLGMETIEMLSRRGVRMRVLTNSLAATDQPVVYSGYSRYVLPMLRLGMEIYELSPSLARAHGKLGRFGESQGMLHAKIMVVDRARVFIGSLNIDGRSERYNTELGILIHSPQIAEDLLSMLDFEGSAYKLRLAPAGDRVQWVAGTAENPQVHDHDPEAGLWRRLRAIPGSLLPEDWL